jgi:lactoylglutathione lyase
MKLNHLNLAVPDVPRMAEFLETFFGLRNGGGNAGFTVLYDDDGLVLSLMKAGRSWGAGYPGTFHLGFYVDSRVQVDELHQALVAAGHQADPPGDTGHSYGFYVTAPGGVQIEVGA